MKGIIPNGKHLEWAEAWFWQFSNGKIIAGRLVVDGVGRLPQLGVFK
jgi:predicted ester cyclase